MTGDPGPFNTSRRLFLFTVLPDDRRCARCLHFMSDPDGFEKAFPGILILSSGRGDSRGATGLCGLESRLVQPSDSCPLFEATPVE